MKDLSKDAQLQGIPQQLSLDVVLRGEPTFDSFVGRANEEIRGRLRQLATAAVLQPLRLWLTGERGTGKSHLLHATCAVALGAGHRACHAPVSRSLLERAHEVGSSPTVWLLDDLGAIVGDRAAEAALMQVYNESPAPIVFASRLHPGACEWLLADLRSRLLAAEVFRLESPDDEDRRALLVARAKAVGLVLADDVLDYMLSRLPRDPATLGEAIERLDMASWRARRRLTLPFVRDVLGLGR